MFYSINDILGYDDQRRAWEIYKEGRDDFVLRVTRELLEPRAGQLKQHFRQNIPLTQFAMFIHNTFDLGANLPPEPEPEPAREMNLQQAWHRIGQQARERVAMRAYGHGGAGGAANEDQQVEVVRNLNDNNEVVWHVQWHGNNEAQGEENAQ